MSTRNAPPSRTSPRTRMARTQRRLLDAPQGLDDSEHVHVGNMAGPALDVAAQPVRVAVARYATGKGLVYAGLPLGLDASFLGLSARPLVQSCLAFRRGLSAVLDPGHEHLVGGHGVNAVHLGVGVVSEADGGERLVQVFVVVVAGPGPPQLDLDLVGRTGDLRDGA